MCADDTTRPDSVESKVHSPSNSVATASPGTSEKEKVRLEHPALYVTTQTSFPLLLTALFAFSLGMLVFAGQQDAATSAGAVFWHLAFVMLSVAAVSFIFGTECCVNSHANDYFALHEERRRFMGISDNREYIAECDVQLRKWHRRAFYSYQAGLIALFAGVGLLFWEVSRFASVVLWLCAAYVVVTLVLDRLRFRRDEYLRRRHNKG